MINVGRAGAANLDVIQEVETLGSRPLKGHLKDMGRDGQNYPPGNISHLGKRKIIFKTVFFWDMLVPRTLP